MDSTSAHAAAPAHAPVPTAIGQQVGCAPKAAIANAGGATRRVQHLVDAASERVNAEQRVVVAARAQSPRLPGRQEGRVREQPRVNLLVAAVAELAVEIATQQRIVGDNDGGLRDRVGANETRESFH